MSTTGTLTPDEWREYFADLMEELGEELLRKFEQFVDQHNGDMERAYQSLIGWKVCGLHGLLSAVRSYRYRRGIEAGSFLCTRSFGGRHAQEGSGHSRVEKVECNRHPSCVFRLLDTRARGGLFASRSHYTGQLKFVSLFRLTDVEQRRTIEPKRTTERQINKGAPCSTVALLYWLVLRNKSENDFTHTARVKKARERDTPSISYNICPHRLLSSSGSNSRYVLVCPHLPLPASNGVVC